MLRLSCMFAWMLLSLPVFAAEQGDAPPAAAVKVAPLPGEPAVAPPDSTSMDAVQPLPSDSGMEQLQQREMAQKKVGLLRATVKSTAIEKGFFSGLFSPTSRPIDTELLQEMSRFIEQFPQLPETPEVYQLKAQVHKRMGNYRAAALDWLVSLAAYPDSGFAFEARNGLQELAGDQLKQQSKTVLAMREKLDTLSGGREQRVAELLAFLGTLQDKEFAPPIIDECNAFLTRNRDYPQPDRILNALAHQKMLLDNESALFYFNELLALYPDSPMLPDTLLSIGNIQRDGKHYDEAVLSYKAVIAKYPDSKQTEQAYEALANMYDQDMHDYSNAVKTYDAIVARYKDDPVVLRSLQAQALIYQNKTNQPLEAIAAYKKLANIFKGKEGLTALLQAEKLAQFTVGDWKLSIDINERIINSYPDSDEAPKALFANAGTYEEKLKDREQALKLYQLFVEHYPGHSLAGQAKQHISALQQQQKKKP